MLSHIGVAVLALIVGYLLGSPNNIETEENVTENITKEIHTERCRIKGSGHERGEVVVEEINVDGDTPMEVTGSVHEDGNVTLND